MKEVDFLTSLDWAPCLQDHAIEPRRCLPDAPFPVPRLHTATSSPTENSLSGLPDADPEPDGWPICH